MENSLLQLFPIEKRGFWRLAAQAQQELQEIRLRIHKPIVLLMGGREFFLDERGCFTDKHERAHITEKEEMEALLNHICHYSLYAYEDELRQGFITVAGGHRVGLAGQVVMENEGSVRTIKYISCVNIRIAHQVKGVGDKVLPYIYERGEVKNTLIISPPGCGKTTLLRDLIRQISDGTTYGQGKCVGVVDERSEIAGSYLGQPQNDVGMRTDVLDACPKALGMQLLLRSMSPQVIAIDELGGEEDMHALHMVASCGSRILATVHGESVVDAVRRFQGNGEDLGALFDCYLILGREQGKPVIRQILGKEEVYATLTGRRHDTAGVLRSGAVVSSAIYTAATDPAHADWHIGNADE